MMLNRLVYIFVYIYFLIAPIYWFPSISGSLLVLIKTSLFCMIIGLSLLLLYANSFEINLPHKLLFLILTLVIAGVISGLVNENDAPVENIIVLFFIMLSGVFHRAKIDLEKVFYYVAITFNLFVLVVFFDFFLSLNIMNPIHSNLSLYQTGFHGGRTGWGLTCGLMLGFVLYYQCKNKVGIQLLTVLIVILNISTLFLMGGRGGLVICTVSVLLYAYYNKKLLKVSLLIFLVLGAIEAFYFNSDIISNSRVITSHSDISNGRISGIIAAFNAYDSWDIFFGSGNISLRDYGFSYDSIHNAWIKLLLEQGVFVFLNFLLVIISICLYIKSRNKMFFIFLIPALLNTLFEPTAILGNLFISGYFWFAIVYAIQMIHYENKTIL